MVRGVAFGPSADQYLVTWHGNELPAPDEVEVFGHLLEFFLRSRHQDPPDPGPEPPDPLPARIRRARGLIRLIQSLKTLTPLRWTRPLPTQDRLQSEVRARIRPRVSPASRRAAACRGFSEGFAS